ncbi:MAG: class I SAM-dependent methyltransferase, partial [Gammaproteobacteria bacterium]|nr:class I SAM-dependent methyltransferase [Gammaproteobacteria bacterium]
MPDLTKKIFSILLRIIRAIPCFIKDSIRCVYYYRDIQKTGSDTGLKQLVDAVFHQWGGILRPIQIQSEITQFLKLAERNRLETVLEIGTANGGTLFLLSRLASRNAHIISIDLLMGRGLLYSIVRLFFFRTFSGAGQRLNILWANSQRVNTRKKVERILNGKKIDLLYIDADHSYEGVKKDFELYAPLVKPDGMIGFHDIVYHPPGTVTHPAEVDRFWNEIK